MIVLEIDGIDYTYSVTGLEKAKLNIARDENIKGLLIKFMDDITFFGDAYEYILDYADTNGDCARIPVSVYYGNQDGSGLEYGGYVTYKDPDTKIDLIGCTITCKVQQDDLSGFILDKLDYVFSVNTATCIDGTTSLTQITEQSTIYQSDINGGVTADPYPSFLVKDLLTQAIEYLTNGAMVLNTTVFDTLFAPEKYETDFNTWIAGETMTIEWTNYYGQTLQASQPFIIDEQTSASFLLTRLIHGVNGTTVGSRDSYFQLFSYVDDSISGATSDLDLYSYFPFTDVTITVSPPRGGADPTITRVTSAAVWGLKNLAVIRRHSLQEQQTQFSITLGQLLSHVTEAFNLSFTFRYGTSGLEMYLDFQENFFEYTEAVDIGGLAMVDKEFSGDFAINQITTPSGVTDNIVEATSWNTEVCVGNQLTISVDGYSSQDFFNAIGGEDKDDKLLWVTLNDALNSSRLYRFDVITALAAGNAPFFKYLYNAPYFSPFIVSRYSINTNKDFTQTIPQPLLIITNCISSCDNGTISNPNTILIDSKYKFSGKLSEQQIRTLQSNNTQFIIFAIGEKQYYGFIYEVQIDLNTGNTEFELLAQDIK